MEIIKQPSGFLLLPDQANYQITSEYFSPQYWQRNNAVVDSKQGRATAWFVRFNQHIAVLKHYYRGGLIGKILKDQYLYLGVERTRVYQEFALLEQLQGHNFPVPTPLAAQITTFGCVYRADILTAAVPGATSVCEILRQRPLTAEELDSIANCIAQFHRHGAYHDDLNINNILFAEDGKVYLIDFDKGKLITPERAWQDDNLARLERSFNKEAGKWPAFHFDDKQWQALKQTYLAAR